LLIAVVLPTGCKVREVHFTSVRSGKLCGAFVELDSEEDVKLALGAKYQSFPHLTICSNVMGKRSSSEYLAHYSN